MGRQVFYVDHEHVPFQPDRLGAEARTDRGGLHDSGCGLRRRQNDREVGHPCHQRQNLRRRLRQRQHSCIVQQEFAIDPGGSRRNKASFCISATISGRSIRSCHSCGNSILLARLTEDMQEILRVLKPGGTLIVIAESYRNGTQNWVQRPVMKLLRSTNLSAEDQRELFVKAGYTDIQTFEERTKGWICAVGKKPA